MSFVTTVRDYIELLNNVYDSVSNNIDFQKILYFSLIFLAKSLKSIFIYLISFQWFHDLTYLPVLIPELSNSILKENFFLNQPTVNFFNIFETCFYQNNKFLVGFLNSFFSCLPLSCSHFIIGRRLVIQGTIAGLVSALGNIFGQCVFLIFIIFGLRFFIIPWFSFEPINYFLGIFLLLTIVYDMVHERRMRPIEKNETKILINIFFINFLLVLMEQSCIFQYLGNLTITSDITLLDTNFGFSKFDFFLQNSLYIFGFFIGSLFFTIFFGILLLKSLNFLYKIFSFPYSTWLKNLNFLFLISIISFSLSSIPFYSIDYLLTSPLGFVSEDKVFENTLFSPNTVKDSIKLIGANSSFKSLDTDISFFDKGHYLKNDSLQTYEDLNFQGEYAWTTRQDRRSLYQQEKSKELILNLFKKTNSKTNETNLDFNKQLNNEDLNFTKQQKSSNLQSVQKEQSSEKNFIKKSNSSFLIEKQGNHFFNLNERFNTDYQLDEQKTSETFTILMDDTFAREFIQEEPKTNLEKKIKEKFYLNPIYKFLLSKEIDFFLFRQPVFYNLDSKQEKLLYEKRLLLKNYYDSLRFYNELPFLEDFNYLFNGSKNYADRIYNQQFKGTLKVVRRLFCITLNQNDTISNTFILKYDQPLFKNNNLKENFLIHEELSIKNIKKTPFLELTNPIPFYLGWDENLKKLILTNRLLPRFYSGFEITQINPKNLNKKLDISKNYKNLVYFLNLLNTSTQGKLYSIEFTTWPIPKKILTKPKSQSQIPYVVLFESIYDPQNKTIENLFKNDETSEWNYETLPYNVRKSNNLGEIIPPKRGGFLWPGNNFLKINIQKLINN
uniref:Hypothetical chloroplast RF1 n=1 Tax=Gloeotilopsis sterilis TaxID=160069 RepID=A0A097KNP8_GLOST|nr:hypothetical chloroplast RF1 [Gloeotilopsis sterilis]AIT94808.1 hypothetical chloroplast RF1 [Gloeotilopsis sterilis]